MQETRKESNGDNTCTSGFEEIRIAIKSRKKRKHYQGTNQLMGGEQAKTELVDSELQIRKDGFLQIQKVDFWDGLP